MDKFVIWSDPNSKYHIIQEEMNELRKTSLISSPLYVSISEEVDNIFFKNGFIYKIPVTVIHRRNIFDVLVKNENNFIDLFTSYSRDAVYFKDKRDAMFFKLKVT